MNYLSINGTIIENAIAGFHSFGIDGRYMPETELELAAVGNRDGDVFRGKRYAGRTLTVAFAMLADTPAQLHRKFERLNAILNQEEAKFIFGDDPDVYYIGTVQGLTEPEGAKTVVAGKIEIYCSNPYKYSVGEFVPDYHTIADGTDTEGSPIYALVDAEGNYIYNEGQKLTFPVPTFGINYDGTMPAHPQLQAVAGADLGYIAFFTDDNQIQLGDPAEIEGRDYQENETLINNTFTSMPSNWTATTSAKIPAGIQQGSTYIAGSRLQPYSYGTSTAGAHGCAVQTAVPADSYGRIGCTKCKFEFKYIFQSNAVAQAGRLTVSIGNDSKYAAAITFYKGKDAKNGGAYLYVNGAHKQTISFVAGAKNAFTQATASIQKMGATITFVVGGKSYSFTDANLTDFAVTKAYIFFGREVYKNKKKQMVQAATMYYIGVYTAKFIELNVEKWEDIPNKFAAGDIIDVDCESGSILINGNNADGYGALGNDWETFVLNQGRNYIGCAYSDWTQEAPTFSMKYRKVYI